MTTKIDLNKLMPPKSLTEQEVIDFKASVRKNWENESVPRLKHSLLVNNRLLQQVMIRQEVVKEMIDELESGRRQLKQTPRRDY